MSRSNDPLPSVNQPLDQSVRHVSTSHQLKLPQGVSVARMQAIDAAAITTYGIPRLLLMDHAGLALANAAGLSLASSAVKQIVMCCGMGFNGGDGLSAARHLHARGYSVHVILAGQIKLLREEPEVYAKILTKLGVLFTECASVEQLAELESTWSTCSLIVDALLGIGARGAAREPIASLIERINRVGVPIISADIPSGLDGDTGHVQGRAVHATVTVAFGLPKQGCFLHEGSAHVGSLMVDPITMPSSLLQKEIR